MPLSEKEIDELIFKPKYPARIMVTVYLYPLGVILFIFFLFLAFASARLFPYGLIAIVFGFTIITMPMILFREIHFRDQSILIKRYYFPSRTIYYEDIVDLTSRGLVARHGGVPLVNVSNRKILEKMIHKLVSRGKIKFEE
jgi:hypothetical protein